MIIHAAEIYKKIRRNTMNYSLAKKFTFGSLMMFALPTTIMMIFTSLYTIIDGVFVSRFVGTLSLIHI